MNMRYAVIGNPVAHSRSPAIHEHFARAAGIALRYERILAPLDGFRAAVEAFRAAGGRGLNVTVPFKREAFLLAHEHGVEASQAQAVNTLSFGRQEPDVIRGDNTDGTGLVRDLVEREDFVLRGRSVLILGAGGAARGIVGPLLDAGVGRLTVTNRSRANAARLVRDLAEAEGRAHRLREVALDRVEPGFDLVIDASGSGLRNEPVALADEVLAAARLACDLFYAAQPTVFMRQARAAGCTRVCDGLGMLVEQAAESFRLWHGVHPDTAPVYRTLRASLQG